MYSLLLLRGYLHLAGYFPSLHQNLLTNFLMQNERSFPCQKTVLSFKLWFLENAFGMDTNIPPHMFETKSGPHLEKKQPPKIGKIGEVFSLAC